MSKPTVSLLRRPPSVVVGLLLFNLGCAGAAPGTQPDDMSAEEHRVAADAHDQEAAQHADQYDPAAAETRTRGTGGEYEFANETYNPTAVHASAAASHSDVADQHRRAAEALESFEQQECGSLPPATRALCPLLGQLASVDDVEGGVRLTYQDGVNVDAAHAHVACHVAFARTQGRERMDECPMYIDGVHAERDESGATLLVVDDEASVAALRSRARAHLHSN